MTPEIGFLFLLVATALVLFALELLPLEATALGLLAILLLSGMVNLEQAIAGFSNKAVITIGALFVLSQALRQTGLLDAAVDRLVGWATGRQWVGVAVLLPTAGVLSGFLNNTAVVAIFIPLVSNLCTKLRLSPSKVLMPLSYASIFGGTLTLIGTSTNLLVSSIAEQSGEPPFSMFEFSRLGVVFLITGLVYVLVLGPRFLPERVKPGDLTENYQLDGYLTEVRIGEGSPLAGETCKGFGLGRRYDLSVLGVVRKGRPSFDNVGTLPLRVGDVLIVEANMDALVRLRQELGFVLVPETAMSVEQLRDAGHITAELLVAPGSSVVGRALAEADFRNQWGGFVMAIRRHGVTLREKVAQTVLRAWDSLLVLLPQARLEDLRRSRSFIVLAELQLPLRPRRFWWLVLPLLPSIVLLAAFGVLEITAGALVGAVLLLVTGAMTPREGYRSVDWSVIFLLAAFVPVGQAFVGTGAANLIATGLLAAAEMLPFPPAFVVLALLYLVTTLLTEMVSNAAAAIILAPIGLSLAATLGVDPRPFLVAICFAGSTAFMSPTGYQTNLMVYAPGGYRFLDYTRFGAPLNLLFWLMATILIPRIWPF